MKKLLLTTILLISVLSFSQSSKALKSYGPVYDIENADFETNLNQEFKAVFDIASISKSKQNPNRKFVTLARYLQLHRAPELKNNSVKAAMVVHGSAIFDLLNHEEYAKHHNKEGLKNPNYDLLSLLAEEGVDVVLCGQSAKSREITKKMMHPKVKLALSAMSVHIQLNKEGYTLINL